MRGAVWPPETRRVTAAVEEVLGYGENRLLSFDDLYAGKMCAALDRQHPRDLFDIALLYWKTKASAAGCSRPFSCA